MMHRLITGRLVTVVAAALCLLSTRAFAQEQQEPLPPAPEEQDSGQVAPASDADQQQEAEFDYSELEEDVVAELKTEKAAKEAAEEPAPPAGRVEIDLGFYFRNASLGTLYELSPLLSNAFRLTEGFSLALDWGFAFLDTSPEEGEARSAFAIGNPFLAAVWSSRQGRTELRYGAGLAIPLSSLPEAEEPDFPEREAAYYTASAMRGRYDHWLWMPEHLGIAVLGGGEMVSPDHIFLGGDTAVAALIPVGDYHDQTASVYLQGAGEIGFGFSEILFLDTLKMVARLQLVSIPVGESDRLQVSLGPCGRAELQQWFLDGRFLFNFDKPDGIYGNGRDIWGLQVGAGRIF